VHKFVQLFESVGRSSIQMREHREKNLMKLWRDVAGVVAVWRVCPTRKPLARELHDELAIFLQTP
jgi:hypothetical protein